MRSLSEEDFYDVVEKDSDYSSTGEYSTSITEYRSFGYYHHGVDIAQPLPPYYSDSESSDQSLSLQDLTHKHIIILMKTICLVSILIARMMILCLLVIQCGNDYISRYL